MYSGASWVAGEVVIGPPETKAGKRRVASSHFIPDLRRHLATYVSPGQNALLLRPMTGATFGRRPSCALGTEPAPRQGGMT